MIVRPKSAVSWLRHRATLLHQSGESGMTTAEYAIGTIAACGFAGVLYKVVTSPQVYATLQAAVMHALKAAF